MASRKFAPPSSARLRLALLRLAPARSAPVSRAPTSLASWKFASRRLAPVRSTPERSRRLKFMPARSQRGHSRVRPARKSSRWSTVAALGMRAAIAGNATASAHAVRGVIALHQCAARQLPYGTRRDPAVHCRFVSRRCKLAPHQGGSMPEIPLLTAQGDAYVCGLAHGRRFAREIAENIQTYLSRFAAAGLAHEQAFAEAERWHAAIAAESPAYAEEMRGISDGSGESEVSITLLNARYELAFTLFGREARRGELLAAGPDGCTTFGVLPQATADGHCWLGQNWDWLAGVHGRTF